MKFTATQIFDGSKFLKNQAVQVTDRQITKVSTSAFPAKGLLLPGIIDSHIHLLGMGLALQAPDLVGVTSPQDFRGRIKAYADAHPQGWIVGRGWDQNKLGFIPEREFLDEICPQRPLVLYRICGHVLSANSQVLDLAGIGPNSPDIPGGTIRREQTGRPTGVLDEAAMLLLDPIIPLPDRSILYSALEKAFKYAWSCGVTGIQTDDLEQVGDYEKLYQLYHSITQGMPLRVQLHHRVKKVSQIQDFARLRKEIAITPGSLVTLGAAKLFLDGSLGARTAALQEPYSDAPSERGVLVWRDEEFFPLVSTAVALDVPLAIHVIGDAAIEQALNALENAKAGPGHRLIHCQVTTKAQMRRMADLGVVAEIQPGFLNTDMHWIEDRLGPLRLQTSYSWLSLWEAGTTLAGGSDAPVEDMNPWLGINAAVTRSDPEGCTAQGWQKDERLSLTQALQIYTKNNAPLAGWNAGELVPGCAADLAWYPDFDYDNLAGNKPQWTIINGERVFAR
jgi:predicted amidohydrolase YtcJ